MASKIILWDILKYLTPMDVPVMWIFAIKEDTMNDSRAEAKKEVTTQKTGVSKKYNCFLNIQVPSFNMI